MSTITRPMTVDEYERNIENGIIPENNRAELTAGELVEKMPKSPGHVWAITETCATIKRLLPGSWHVRQEAPVRIPEYDEPEPDLSIARGTRDDYLDRHPEPADVALVVEVPRSTVYDDRAMAPIYGRAAASLATGSSTWRIVSSKCTRDLWRAFTLPPRSSVSRPRSNW